MAELNARPGRETLFCGLYSLLGDPAEAAVRAGYPPENALREAVKLLNRPQIRADIARRSAEERRLDRDRILAGLLRLALGGTDDPRGDDVKPSDRLKAFELLLGQAAIPPEPGAHSLYTALERGAAALNPPRQGREDDEL